MTKQFFTTCNRCGRQILMTYNEKNGKWIPCDPEIYRFRQAGGPFSYVRENGVLVRGVRDRYGEFGYRRHRRDCDQV